MIQNKDKVNLGANTDIETSASKDEMRIYSIDEQHRIVQGIEARLSVCDKIEGTIAESLLQAEALRQSILKKAFEGKLT